MRKKSLTQHGQVVRLVEIPVCCYDFAGVISLMSYFHLPHLKGGIMIWSEFPVDAVTAACSVCLVLISPVPQGAEPSNFGVYFPCYHSYIWFGRAGQHRAATYCHCHSVVPWRRERRRRTCEKVPRDVTHSLGVLVCASQRNVCTLHTSVRPCLCSSVSCLSSCITAVDYGPSGLSAYSLNTHNKFPTGAHLSG